jgi:hypothetical protein
MPIGFARRSVDAKPALSQSSLNKIFVFITESRVSDFEKPILNVDFIDRR